MRIADARVIVTCPSRNFVTLKVESPLLRTPTARTSLATAGRRARRPAGGDQAPADVNRQPSVIVGATVVPVRRSTSQQRLVFLYFRQICWPR